MVAGQDAGQYLPFQIRWAGLLVFVGFRHNRVRAASQITDTHNRRRRLHWAPVSAPKNRQGANFRKECGEHTHLGTRD